MCVKAEGDIANTITSSQCCASRRQRIESDYFIFMFCSNDELSLFSFLLFIDVPKESVKSTIKYR